MANRLLWMMPVLALGALPIGAAGDAGAMDGGNRGAFQGSKVDGRAVLDREMLAVRALEKLGAKITRDEKRKGRPVIAVQLEVQPGRRIDLPCLAALTQLEELTLSGTGITDTELLQLSGLRHLRQVNLGESVSKAGLAALRKASLAPGLTIVRTTVDILEEERQTGVVIPPTVIP
jgi:hypothetical protein